MSVRTLLALISCLAAAVALIVWLGRRPAPEEAAAPTAALIGAFSEDALRQIELTCGATSFALARAKAGGWRIARPVDSEADRRRVKDLIASLQEARVKKVISDPAEHLAAYGLSPPACTVRLDLSPNAPAVTLSLGRASPIGNDRYAAVNGKSVLLTDGSLFTSVARGPEAFREKRIFPVEPEAITRMALDRPDGRLVVSRAGDAWRLEAPFRDVASSSACTDLARALTALTWTSPDTVPAPVGAIPSRRLRVEIAAQGSASPEVAFVAAAGIDGKRLSWRDGVALAGLVEESAAHELDRPMESFRDPRIATFSDPDVRQITIDRGGTSLRITRAAEGSPWSGADGAVNFPVDDSRVVELLDRMRTLTASGFEPVPPPTVPTGTIAISGGTLELARLTWGTFEKRKDAGAPEVWLTTPSRPGVVFRMGAASFGTVPARAADLAPLPARTGPASSGS